MFVKKNIIELRLNQVKTNVENIEEEGFIKTYNQL